MLVNFICLPRGKGDVALRAEGRRRDGRCVREFYCGHGFGAFVNFKTNWFELDENMKLTSKIIISLLNIQVLDCSRIKISNRSPRN